MVSSKGSDEPQRPGVGQWLGAFAPHLLGVALVSLVTNAILNWHNIGLLADKLDRIDAEVGGNQAEIRSINEVGGGRVTQRDARELREYLVNRDQAIALRMHQIELELARIKVLLEGAADARPKEL